MSCDIASVRIARPAAEVFTFVTNPDKLSLWSFGTWRVQVDETGLVHGTSIKNGAPICVRIDPHPEHFLVDYLIGPDPGALQPRIFIRIAEGTAIGAGAEECLLMMTAVRSDGMSDEHWAALRTAHAFEVDLIKSAIESGYDHRNA